MQYYQHSNVPGLLKQKEEPFVFYIISSVRNTGRESMSVYFAHGFHALSLIKEKCFIKLGTLEHKAIKWGSVV